MNVGFDELSENKKNEATDVFCDLFCNRFYDYHRCTDDGLKAFVGSDLMNITDDFDDETEEEVTYFPCDSCDNRYKRYEDLKRHITSYHCPDNLLKCSWDE